MSLRSPMLPVWRRNVDYRSIFFEETVQTVVGTVCSILFAFVDPTVWAIVLGTLAGSVASTITTFVISPMLPGRMHRHCIRELATFGGQILVNTAMMALWMNLDRIAGLKLLSATDMGLFAIAYNLAAAAEGFVNRACDVHFSLLSRCETEEEQARWHTRITRMTAQWACPLLAIGVLIAPWVIDLLYDVRYHGAGVLLSILLARLMIRTFGQVQFQWLLARAQINLATISYLVAFITQAILIVPMCLNFGIVGLALSTLISTIVLTMTQAIIIHELVHRGLGDLWLSICWTSVPLIALLAFLLS